jgi:polar amino acid transport system substrate-binding protein
VAGLPARRVRAVAAVVLCLGFAACGEDSTAGVAAPEPVLVDEGSLTVCTSLPYEPFEFRKHGETVGFDIDLASQVAEELRLSPRIVNADFDAIQSGELLNDGRCDVAIAGMTITGDRARVVDFSSPYFNAAQAMVVTQGSGVSSLKDLGGLKIAVQSGTTGELYVTDHAPNDAEIVTFDDASDVDAALQDGDVAAAVYDNTVVRDVTARNPEFEVAAEFDTGEQYGMAVKKNGNVELLRTINAVLARLDASGGYDELYRKWFGKAPTT